MSENTEQGKGLTLILMRHCEDVRRGYEGNDKESPLTDKGKTQAAAMGQYIDELEMAPDFVLCANCERAKETLKGMGLDVPEDQIAVTEDLYSGSADEYIQKMQMLEMEYPKAAGAKKLLDIGRRPAGPEAVEELTGHSDKAVPSEEYDHGTISVIRFDDIDEWKSLFSRAKGLAKGTLLNVAQPGPDGQVVELVGDQGPEYGAPLDELGF